VRGRGEKVLKVLRVFKDLKDFKDLGGRFRGAFAAWDGMGKCAFSLEFKRFFGVAKKMSRAGVFFLATLFRLT
jgi:hypothetical protein